jgi:mono/diheme cytochrome c family protein
MSHSLSLRRIFIAATFVVIAGCENGTRDMYDQPKYKPLGASTLWEDGRASRPLEPGTVVHSTGALAGTSSGRFGAIVPNYQEQASFTVNALQRGRQRYEIYCSPCHGLEGDGDGYITRRGFPHPPSYHNDRLRSAPDLHFYQVITNGYGTMYPYADRLSPDDRWAVVAYVRALQLSQHAGLEQVPAEERMRLESFR